MSAQLIEIAAPSQLAAPRIGILTGAATSIALTAHAMACSTVHSIGRELPWFNSAREVRDEVEGIFARHFERQLAADLALCIHCGSVRVNYCERAGRTGVSFDGEGEVSTEVGYLCTDCGAFEDAVIEVRS